ncbi:helix-turn-helix domain-containing protein [Puniceicoccus vermicola]|uniref:Helix-turn-helix transcriptional regulator n=1 Tax=Puniceicoccus vermicola TaxID=388746 RepID=A0A7X1E313_9BACT|nr:helix-turn-helix transcriptional regulator [Puniceicoccus vermicola]
MSNFSEVVREFVQRRGLTGSQLAEDIGLSAVAVSRIVTGQSKPRQVTLSRLMKRLCTSKEEEQMLIAAYESKGVEDLPLAPIVSEAANAQAEEERVRRFMEVKAQSIAFKRSVARELDKLGIPYRQEVIEKLVVTDFLLELGERRIALECKYNLHRDLEKSVISARLIREQFHCDQVYIVVPFYDEEGDSLDCEEEIRILPLQDLAEAINLENNE